MRSATLVTAPLREASYAYCPAWARAAILYWSAKDPDHEYLIGWAPGARTGSRAVRVAVKQHDPTSPLASRSHSWPGKMRSVAPGECVLTTKERDEYAWGVRFAEIRLLSDRERPVRVAESAVAWRDRKKTTTPRRRSAEKTAAPGGPVHVSVARNLEKKGLELRFSGVPDMATRAKLREAGWRWSGRLRIWWVAYSPEAEAFAARLDNDLNAP